MPFFIQITDSSIVEALTPQSETILLLGSICQTLSGKSRRRY